jgi:addiction module HigA family antidote
MGKPVAALAEANHVTRSCLDELCHGRRGVTANVAPRLGRYFGVDPRWFINMQAKYDLHIEAERLAADLAAIAPRAAA